MTEQAQRGKMNNAFDPKSLGDLDPAARSMIERRARLLGPAYRLFYNKPLAVTRGKGVHLWDNEGNKYLDAYNNVVSIGHGHPRVVEAITNQLGKIGRAHV